MVGGLHPARDDRCRRRQLHRAHGDVLAHHVRRAAREVRAGLDPRQRRLAAGAHVVEVVLGDHVLGVPRGRAREIRVAAQGVPVVARTLHVDQAERRRLDPGGVSAVGRRSISEHEALDVDAARGWLAAAATPVPCMAMSDPATAITRRIGWRGRLIWWLEIFMLDPVSTPGQAVWTVNLSRLDGR